MHRDMREYAGRVSDLEGQITAVREETAQLRQQIPVTEALRESVSNLAARLLTLELAQKQWEDDSGADWYEQQQDETLEQGLEQVMGNATAHYTMSDGGSTPRDKKQLVREVSLAHHHSQQASFFRPGVMEDMGWYRAFPRSCRRTADSDYQGRFPRGLKICGGTSTSRRCSSWFRSSYARTTEI